MVEQVSDFKMPEKIVTRLLKEALPEDVVISKEAKNVACRGASVFILQLSILAAEKASANRRRNLDTKDIIEAAGELGLHEHAPQLVRFQAQRKRNATRKVANIQKSRSKKASNNMEQRVTETVVSNGMDSNLNVSDNQEEPMSAEEVEEEPNED